MIVTKYLFDLWLTQFSKNVNWDIINNKIYSCDIIKDNYHKANFKKIKGDLFEWICKYYFIYQGYDETYLFSEVPSGLREKFKFNYRDEGIDLITKINNEWFGIQCKWVSNTNKSLKKHVYTQLYCDIDTYNLDKGIIFTNTTKVNPTFNINPKHKKIITWYTKDQFYNITDTNFINFIKQELFADIQQEVIKVPKNLRYYQIDAVNSLLESNDRNKQIIMPCSSGKTLVMMDYIRRIGLNNKILLLFPNLNLINQMYKKLNIYLNNPNLLCICSQFDANQLILYDRSLYNNIYTTEPEEINRRMNKNIIILCTYQSSKLLKGKYFNLAIFDEAHKTVSGREFGFAKYDKNCRIDERVYFTATPKYYSGKNSKCYSMKNESIYGKIVYQYPFRQAIDDGYILDYNLITYISDNSLDNYLTNNFIKNKYGNLNITKNELICAIQIAQYVQNYNGQPKILTYHNTVNSANKFKKTLYFIFNKYKISADIFTISGSDNISNRNKILANFEKANIGILCSAKVLNEGIDLPYVNTVAFIDNRTSTIDIIQNIGRSMRLYGDQKECNIIVPTNINDENYDYKNIINILSALNTIDTNIIQYFTNDNNQKNKIKVIKTKIECLENIDIIEYDNIDIAILKNNIINKAIKRSDLSFNIKKELLFKFCNKHKRIPVARESYKGVNIGQWFYREKYKIEDENCEVYKKLSTCPYIKRAFDEYLDSNLVFNENISLLFKFCNEKKRYPKPGEKYKDFNVSYWLNDRKKEIISEDDDLYKILSTNKYVKLSIDNCLNYRKSKCKSRKYTYSEKKKMLFEFCNGKKRYPKNGDKCGDFNVCMWLSDKKKEDMIS